MLHETGKSQMNDMTTGNPAKRLLLFMIPVLMGNLFQNFYTIIDTVIVGRFLGVDALAAVGTTGSIVFLVVGWICGMTSGFGILIAQAFGAKDEKQLRHFTLVSAYVCIAFAVVMTVGLTLTNGFILKCINTPDNIWNDTYAYIGIIYLGLPATMLYNMLASVARSLGDSKTPLYFLAFSSVLNIGLDLWFVGGTTMGVAGASYATVLSQAISGILCFIYVYKKYPMLHYTRAEGTCKVKTVIQLLGMGIPMGLQFSITAIGTMIVQSAVNQLGSIYIAAYAAAAKIQGLCMQVHIALGAAIANYVGQNFGANQLKRIQQGIRVGIIITAIYTVMIMVFGYFVSPNLIPLFAEDTTGELVQIGRMVFHISLWFYFPLGLISVYRNALQGLGNGFVPMMGGVFELMARGLVIVLLFDSLQFTGICLADPLAWVAALIPLVPYYYWYMNKTKKESIELEV